MDIGWPEILIIAAVILVLFGSKKLPDAARSLGRSMRILKTEVKGMHDDDQDAKAARAGRPAAGQHRRGRHLRVRRRRSNTKSLADTATRRLRAWLACAGTDPHPTTSG